MQYSISSIKQSLLSKTGSRALTNIANLYSMIQETCFEMMRQVDLPSSKRKQPFFAPLVEEPNLYMLPNDYSHNGLIDVYQRDYTNTRPRIRTGAYGSEVMRTLQNNSLIELDDIDGVQFVNLGDQEYKRAYVIDSCDDSTNGTWTAVGDATNVRFDTAHKITGSASLSFDIPVTATQFGVQKLNIQDTASATDMAYITMNVYFPIYITSVAIRYGVDVGNYKEITITRDWQGKRFTTGWNTLLFEIADATTTGVLANDDITYFSYLIDDNIATAQTGFKIDSIYISEGYSYDIKYYSSSIIQNQYGERIDTCLPTADSDVILLNNREYQLFVKQFAVLSSVDTMVTGGVSQFNAYNQALIGDYEQFRMDFPSERLLISSHY